MELAQYQLQIFVSLVVILGAAFVALICDFLKGSNEQLRELTVELKVRREEEHKRSLMMTPRPFETAAVRKAVASGERAALAEAASAETESSRMTSAETESSRMASAERASSATSETTEAREGHARPAASASTASVRAVRARGGFPKRAAAAEAMAAMERGAAMAASPRRPNPLKVPAEGIAFPAGVTHEAVSDEAAMDRPALQHASATAWKTQVPAAEVVAAPAMSASRPVVTQAATPVSAPVATQVILTQAAYATNTGGGAARPRTNWGDLLARRSQPNRATTLVTTSVTAQTAPAQAPHADARRDLLDAVVAETSSQNAQAPDVAVPAGFHDGFVLSRLVQSHKPVSGLVVSIGVSATQEAGGAQGESDSAPVRNLIQSLMGPQDFACASGPDEYLLIFPQERGAAAQRRLSAISQKLWDFQLQALGAASILFSWGGVEVRGESIEEAIASASERMQETRRGRSAKSFDTQALKIAV